MYDLDVAIASTKANQKLSQKSIDSLIERVARGEHPNDIAKRIHPGRDERVARQRLRRKLTHALIHDQRVAQAIGERAKGELLVGLVPSAKALARRAGRGNVPAIKLISEATGFHNPRVKHEHSGEIKVTMDIPRPTMEQDRPGIDVPDAEVVDDD